MIVVYCPRKSKSAYDLTGWFSNHGVLALRAHSTEELCAYLVNEPDLVIAWGNPLHVDVKRSLNAKAPLGNKYAELGTLNLRGVPAPRVSAEPVRGWLARTTSHQDGNDLAQNLRRGDFYVERVETTHEFRINVFNGKAFRTGLKRPMTAEERRQHNAPEAHEFIRTKPFGWTWTYKQSALDALPLDRTPFRVAAETAVKALGYSFGAVDVGRRTDTGGPMVFEVNTSPALEGSDLARWGQLFVDYATQGENGG